VDGRAVEGFVERARVGMVERLERRTRYVEGFIFGSERVCWVLGLKN